MGNQPPVPHLLHAEAEALAAGVLLFDRFRLVRPLGEGAMANVWLVADEASGESLSLKLLSAEASAHAESLRQEFERLARVDHPNVVHVHDFGVLEDGRPFFTMEWIDGRPLDRAMPAGDWNAFLSLTSGACAGVAAVHAAGLVHGDLKPANLLVTGDDVSASSVRIVDFGLASRVGETTKPRGTLGFAAPEVLDGTPPDSRSDLYSLGATLFATLAGRAPFAAKSVSKLAKAQFSGPPDATPLRATGAPEGIIRAVMLLLEPDPRRRPASAHDAAGEFASAIGRRARGGRRAPSTARAHATRPVLARGSLVGHTSKIAAAELRAGAPSPPLLVVGPSGSGRSRFLRELAVRAEVAGGRAVVLSCAGRADAGAEWLGRVQAVLGIPGAPSWTRILESLADKGPVLLALEDLHVAGEDTLAVAREVLASSVPSIARVLLSWAEPTPASSDAFERFRLLTAGPWIGRAPDRIELTPLSPSDAAAMVRTLLGGSELPEVEAAAVAHAGGLPAWIEATLEHWIDRGTLRQQDGVWFARPGADLGTPAPAFEEVLRERVASLSENARAFLVAVADLGGEVETSQALEVAELPIESSQEAISAGLVVPAHTGLVPSVHLQTELVGAIASATLPPDRRRRQGVRAADRMLAAPVRAAELLLEATEPERALAVLRTAGASSNSLVEAWSRARLTLLCLERLGRVSLLDLEQAASAADQAMRFKESAALWHRIAAETKGDALRKAQAQLRSAEAYRWLGEHGRVDEILSEIEVHLADVQDSQEEVLRLRSSVLSERAWLLTIRGDQRGAEGAAREALQLAPDSALRERFTAWNRLAVILPRQGRIQDARLAITQALKIAREMGDETASLRAIGNAIEIVRNSDDAQEEERLLNEQLSLADQQSNLQTRCRALSGLAGVAVRQHSTAIARAALLQAESACRVAGDPLILATVLNGAARLELRVGHLRRSARLTKSALRLANAVGIAEIKRLAWNRLGIIRGLRGDRTASIKCHRRALTGIHAEDRTPGSIFPLVYLADLALDENKLTSARRLIRRAGIVGRSHPVLAAWIARTEARLAALDPNARTPSGVKHDGVSIGGPSDLEARGAYLEARGFAALADRNFDAAIEAFDEAGELYSEFECFLALARLRASAAVALLRRGASTPALEAVAHRWANEAGVLFERMKVRKTILEGPDVPLPSEAEELEKNRMAENQAQANALFEISQLINSILDFPELLHRSLEIAVNRLGAERGLILLVDRETAELTPVARHGELDADAQSDALQISTSIVRRVADTGHTFRSEDVEADPRLTSQKSVFELSLRSVLCAALRMRGDVIGTIYLQNRTVRASFTDADVAFLESFSNLVAIAIENSRLHEGLRQANEALVSENVTLRREVTGSFRFANLVGRSREMGQVQALIERFAQSDADVFIQGETGTGKELIAKTIHYNSPRKDRPFLTVSCVALPETLIESELFGIEDHVATGVRARPGIFERAEGGSVLLDEIGDMPHGMQARLLRVLQEREFSRVGGRRTYRMNVRILAATNADLRERVRDGRFRADLYFRVNRLVIQLPNLRDRKSDLPLLARHFAHQFCERMEQPVPKFSSELLDVLGRGSWPGNVRELEHYIERLLVINDEPVLYPKVLPDDLEDLQAGAAAPTLNALRATGSQNLAAALSSVERDLIGEALRRAGGNRSRAARALGMAEPTLRYRLKRLGLVSPSSDDSAP
jgi:Nif-specific regulatory protein